MKTLTVAAVLSSFLFYLAWWAVHPPTDAAKKARTKGLVILVGDPCTGGGGGDW